MTNRNNINRKPSSADSLSRAMASTERKQPPNDLDDFAEAVARKLESRRITRVPGLPEDQPADNETWVDRALEFDRMTRELEAEWEAKRRAQENPLPKTTADLVSSAMAESYRPTSRADMPLNGPGIIAAAGGNPYASNSYARDSVADLVRRGLMPGSVQDGRNE
ncbi:hypothetical protein [Nocardia cyriacigeorgica]|uniref:hypothetical protein n=1 Tax=Nocardia cyriacigeorgica TaxID=135487 RepID=UPI00189639CF|nr:hypothetical protein [Nocardia cyriacigeorgica]MBF6425588.1 hypothetical protein [Nocardia cyriacigeorgica]